MKLPETLVASRAAALLQALEPRLASGGTLTLDGGDVARVDTAGIQLLLYINRELARRGGSLRWSAASVTLTDAARLLGLEGALAFDAK